MKLKKIIVETATTKIDQDVCSELDCYSFARSKFGDKNVFLLESLSGPARDRKASIIGVDVIFGIDIYSDNAKLHGDVAIVNYIITFLEQDGFVVNPKDFSIKYLNNDKDRVWNLLRSIKNAFQLPKNDEYTLSYFGYFAYETIRFIENIPEIINENYDYPIIALNVYQTFIIYHVDGRVETVVNNCSLWNKKTSTDYQFLLSPQNNSSANITSNYPTKKEVLNKITKNQYCENVKTALKHINIGDIYQIQLGHEIHVKTEVDPLTVYKTLRDRNPSPYMFIANVGGVDLIGASPELFVSLQNDIIEMRPIAGTAGKKSGKSNQEIIDSMTNSVKERAEHVMLVDLCRNDISRICKTNSLEVDELMVVEEYSHLFHMVSNVKAVISQEYDVFDIIKATFPAGTMTGTPKVKAMELIEKFETSKRGIYAGAIGLIGFNNTMNTALCIRSTFRQNGVYHLRASAGAVSDSIPENEWMETLYKISSVYYAVTKEELIK